jgi:hypothetical protein
MTATTPRFSAVTEPTDAVYDSERDVYAPFPFGLVEALIGHDTDTVIANFNGSPDEFETRFEWLPRAEFEAEYA